MRVRAPKLFPGIHKFTSNGFDVHRMDVWKWKIYMKICEKYKHMFDFGLYWLAILILQVFKFTCFIIGLRGSPPMYLHSTTWSKVWSKTSQEHIKTTESWEKDWSRLLIIQSWKLEIRMVVTGSTYIPLADTATQVWFCEAWRGSDWTPWKNLDVKGPDGCYNSYWSWAPRKTTKNGARCVEMKFWSSHHGFSMNITSIGWWWMMNPPFWHLSFGLSYLLNGSTCPTFFFWMIKEFLAFCDCSKSFLGVFFTLETREKQKLAPEKREKTRQRRM